MAFRFNFFDENNAIDQSSDAVETRRPVEVQVDLADTEIPIGVLTRDQVQACCAVSNVPYLEHRASKDVTIRMINGGELSAQDQVAKVTDVLPGHYEGGLKIWECSYDAIDYLSRMDPPTRLLDLGCGSGLVGIWALMTWPNVHVTFHDLNLSVLQSATAPNVALNDTQSVARSDFVYGPWDKSLQNLTSQGRYDLISTADTLYDPDAMRHLHDLLLNVLTPNGRAIIAAKRFYFGVGGGVSSFVALVNQLGKAKVQVVASFEDGGSNIRDVLEFRLA